MRRSLYLATALLMSLAAAGPASAATVVNVGHLGLFTEMPLYVAMEKGYLAEKGIEVKFLSFRSSGEMIAPLATNQLQAFVSGINPATYNAIARGLPISLVASAAALLPGHDPLFLVARTDLKDKLTKISDLKGKKVALNAPMTADLYFLVKGLESEGLTVKDIDIVYISFPDMPVALTTKAVDVAVSVEPFPTLIEAKGIGAKWKKASDFMRDPYFTAAAVYFNKEWARDNPEVAKNFVLAWMRGARDVLEAYEGGVNREQIVNIAVKLGRLKDKALYDKMEWMFANPNGYIDKKSIEDQVNWFFPRGMITHKVTPDQVVDDSFVTQALKEIGDYKVTHRGH